MSVLHLTKENFEKEVLESEEIVLVDFWAAWCGPCQMLVPVIEELSNENTMLKICKLNVEDEPGLAEKYGIMTIPTVVIFNKGSIVERSIGVKTKEEILALVNK